ncbi:hypothetical protein Nepgr_027965 [Nepenthes gracilis]|uniref:Uncharacterized protein n=1 Tax=Nepenthes gracilis TaxID=150966 RepID=A0AAD3TB34_NEPGR|nr:hypothetical protein Nepgr_027965 [Nepenthes gracilis]
MGNCQAVDAAAMVIQHPNGKLERLYWPIQASEVMRMNPGYYVSLIIPVSISNEGKRHDGTTDKKAIRFTRVKLLRPTDTLVLGRAYRLVSTQEVMRVLRAKNHAKKKKKNHESEFAADELQRNPVRNSSDSDQDAEKFEMGKNSQAVEDVRRRARTALMSSAVSRSNSKSWRPSLQSISEAGS